MNRFLLLAITALSILFLDQCANPIPPTGGPKDTIPPSLISSNPALEELNFNKKLVRLSFDEFINADQIKSNLIITPNQDIKYSHLIKKNDLIIKLQSELTDSTTYIFNFFNGVTDITEKNPVENLILAFSTGDFIDSIKVSGRIKNLWNQQPAEDMTFGLYVYSDTLDYEETKPIYFIRTDDQGNFQLQNVKAGDYKIFAFKDENNNLLFEPESESHTFLSGVTTLEENLDSVFLQGVLLDTRIPQILSARPLSNFFQVRFNKSLTNYHVHAQDTGLSVYSRFEDDNTVIKFYKQPHYPDSVLVFLSASDSLRNQVKDTIYLKYNESKRKQEQFAATFPNGPQGTFDDSLKFSILFNKPVQAYDFDSLFARADTLLNMPLTIRDSSFNWNHNRTKVSFRLPFSWQNFSDSLKNRMKLLFPNDSTRDFDNLEVSSAQLFFPSGAFTSLHNDTTTATFVTFRRLKESSTGKINYELQTSWPSFTVQLIDKDYRTVQQVQNKKSSQFSRVPPGSYGLRILLDTNQNGTWENANLNEDREPEPLFINPEFTELRSNWEITIGPISVP